MAGAVGAVRGVRRDELERHGRVQPHRFEDVDQAGQVVGLGAFAADQVPLDLRRVLVVVDDVPAHAARLGRAEIGTGAELGDGERLAEALIGPQLADVVRRVGVGGVVVDADDVEQVPVDLVLLGGGVAQAAVEDGPADGGGSGGEAVQAALHPLPVDGAVQEVLDPLHDVVARHDPRHEQPELAAHAEVDTRALAAQVLGVAAGLGDVVEDVPLGGVAEGRLEPDPQSTLGGLGGGGVETLDPVAGDVHGVGVQLVPDRGEVGAHPCLAEGGARGLPRADGVDDAPVPQPTAAAPGGPRGARREQRPRDTGGAEGRGPGQETRPADPLLGVLHAPTVASGRWGRLSADGLRRGNQGMRTRVGN